MESDGLGEELHVDVADPVGAALPLPDHLDIDSFIGSCDSLTA